jgi:D-tyrosyl-tRNA(Tyr) deacylase
MRAVIQRVTSASVEIDSVERSAIGKGLLVFLGIEDSDNQADIEWLCGKIIRLRIFSDDQGLMNLSVEDIQGDILVISQFTLHASTKKGNRPSFVRAAKPDHARKMVANFLERMKDLYPGIVRSGVFGANMKINLVNDGPVTIFMDTKNKE